MEEELYRLRHDPSRLRQEAHRIGMLSENEIRVRMPASLPDAVGIPTAGIASKPESKALSKPLITGISVSLGIMILLIMTLIDFETTLIGQRSNRRFTYLHQGIRVQTASRE
jgi:hypothetical protein